MHKITLNLMNFKTIDDSSLTKPEEADYVYKASIFLTSINQVNSTFLSINKIKPREPKDGQSR